jgi:hypothetical protein
VLCTSPILKEISQTGKFSILFAGSTILNKKHLKKLKTIINYMIYKTKIYILRQNNQRKKA